MPDLYCLLPLLDYSHFIAHPYLKTEMLDRNKQKTMTRTDTYSSLIMTQVVSIDI
jgi:hypothetical protein